MLVAVRDVNRDKHPDVVTWSNDAGVPCGDGTVRYGPFTRDGASTGDEHGLRLEY